MAQIRLDILATSDLHMALGPSEPGTDDGAHLLGLSSLIAAARKRHANCLLFDNGDFLQGGPVGHGLQTVLARNPRMRHPMSLAMNSLRYDAVGLGNHEFDYGLGYLHRALRGLKCPILCANLDLPEMKGGAPILPWQVLTRQFQDDEGAAQTLRIGVFSVMPPQVVVWSRDHLPMGTTASPIAEAAERARAALRRAGADVVVGLVHSGVSKGLSDDHRENMACAVAALEGIDVVVAGHTHEVFPGPDFEGVPGVDLVNGRVHGVPLCQPGAHASHLGQITLHLARTSTGRWGVSHGAARVLSAEAPGRMRPLSSLRRRNIALLDATAPYLGGPIGRTDQPLTSYLDLVADSATTRLVALAMRDHVRMALAGTLFQDIPVLAAAASQRCGGHDGPGNYVDIPAGPLRERDIAALSPFPNRLHALLATGATLRAWLEHAAGVFAQLVPDRPEQRLLRPEIPPFSFDVIEGLTYEIDLSVPPRTDAMGRLQHPLSRRIVNLRYSGQPVQDASVFVLAVNNYRSSGGGYFPGTGRDAAQLLPNPPPMVDVLRQWLRETGTYRAPRTPIWRFTPLENTFALFETGPAASQHLPKAGVEIGAKLSNGFVLARLTLCPLALQARAQYHPPREVGAGRHLANPVRSGRKQP